MTSHDCVWVFFSFSLLLSGIDHRLRVAAGIGCFTGIQDKLGRRHLTVLSPLRTLKHGDAQQTSVWLETGMFESWHGGVWELLWERLRFYIPKLLRLDMVTVETWRGSVRRLALECSRLDRVVLETWYLNVWDLHLESSYVNVWDLSCKGLKTGTKEFETWQGLPLRTNTDE